MSTAVQAAPASMLPSSKKLGKRPMSDEQLREYYAKQPKCSKYDSDYEDEDPAYGDRYGTDPATNPAPWQQHLYPAPGVAVGPVAPQDEHARDLLEALNQAPLASEVSPGTPVARVRLTAHFIDADDEVVRRNLIAAELTGLYDDEDDVSDE